MERVEGVLSELDDLIRRGEGLLEVLLDVGQQHVILEGLGEVVLGIVSDVLHDGRGLLVGREDDDVPLVSAETDLADHLVTRDVRQPEVDDDEVGSLVEDQRDGFSSECHRNDAVLRVLLE